MLSLAFLSGITMDLVESEWSSAVIDTSSDLITEFPILSYTSIFMFFYSIYYFGWCIDRPKVFYGSSSMSQMLSERCSAMSEVYFPTPWVMSRHLQCLLTLALRPPRNITYTRDYYIVSDGATFLLDWSFPSAMTVPDGVVFASSQEEANIVNKRNNKRRSCRSAPASLGGDTSLLEPTMVLVLCPGFTGNSDSRYVQPLVEEATRRGWVAVVVNYPGTLPTVPMSTPRFINPTAGQDMKEVAEHIASMCKRGTRMIGHGQSMGGHLLAKYLGLAGQDTPMDGAVVISNPWNIAKAVNNSGFMTHFIYNAHFTRAMLKIFKNNQALFDAHDDVDTEAVLKSNRMAHFDEHLSRRVNGFDTVEEYYDACDSSADVHNIEIPFLVMHSADDPVAIFDNLPTEKLKKNPNSVLVTTRTGSHASWLEGVVPLGLTYAERVTLQYIDELNAELDRRAA
eukprot:TRINITY_DN8842_c0_g1_i1.p1 TRINITY_DN8842_c0_g1~~TRINITY_DN8842_c0_g1_i1.p1  ORF type:complete len:468 (+),score=99.33 TRINITY_DN8842_c0_g1_i1:47-1405(+)